MHHSSSRRPGVSGPVRRQTGATRHLLGITALAVGVALVGAACAPGGDAANADGKTVLTVYAWKGGDAEPANMKQINDAFVKANPDIALEFEFVPANEKYTQRVQPELLAGNSADVIMTDSAKVQDWGSAGYLEDLSSQSWVSGVRSDVAPFVKESGKVYALPMEVIGISLYANADVLAEIGVDAMPTTWPDFVADLQKAKDAGITPIALPNKNGWTGASVLNAIAATKVYQENPDFDQEFLAGTASFDAWKSSAEQMMELQTKGFIDFKTELGVDEWSTGIADFQAAKSAFYFQGAWNQSAFAAAGMNDVFLPWPAADSGQSSANLFVGTMWSVNAESKVKDAAEAYVKFWADSANAAPFLEAENAVTPFTDGTSPSTDATRDFVAAVDAGKYRILPSNTWFSAEGEKTMQQQVQALWLGDQDIDQMLANFDAKLATK